MRATADNEAAATAAAPAAAREPAWELVKPIHSKQSQPQPQQEAATQSPKWHQQHSALAPPAAAAAAVPAVGTLNRRKLQACATLWLPRQPPATLLFLSPSPYCLAVCLLG